MQIAHKPILNNESGSALLLAIMVLVALTAMSVITIRMSSSSLDQAANDKFHKMNFFKTDADTDLSAEMVEQNIEQRGFGDSGPPIVYGNNGDIEVFNSEYHLNAKDPVCQNNIPSETNRDFDVNNSGGDKNTTHAKVFGDRNLNPGSGLEISAGYHGRGKGVASGGVQIVYTIRTYGRGVGKSQTRLSIRWRHVT